MTAILGIETSCDETAAAIVIDGCNVKSNIVSSQIAQHAPYGGVVPELAAREHLSAISHVVREALNTAGLSLKEIDAVSVTHLPGLLPALLVGLNFAKGLSVSHELPLIGINHFAAHIYGSFLDIGTTILQNDDTYPLLALVVSGGHTGLLLISADGKTELVGTTLDDASGEALDKAAKLLDLGYPGGPVIEKTALQGNPDAFSFPRSMTGATGKKVAEENRFNFSFSGVKTSLLYHCKNHGSEGKLSGKLLFNTVASYQEAIIDVLCRKTLDAVTHFNAASLVLCGGVACNTVLRTRLEELLPSTVQYFPAPRKYCTDNAAMVAGLAWHAFKKRQFNDLGLDAVSRLPKMTTILFR